MTIRVQQKERTRTALIAAARQLVADGRAPTVEDAAEAAGISRTTAYRYFKNQAELLAAAHPETQVRSFLPEKPPSDVGARVDAVVRELARVLLETEPQPRTMLRLSLDPKTPRESLPLRQGRAIRWLEEALEPLAANGTRWPKAKVRRLALAIRTTIGIEALVWLTDVAGLTREEAVKTMRWSAAALLRGALSRHD
jgi:AcrR family transcriptional regulator